MNWFTQWANESIDYMKSFIVKEDGLIYAAEVPEEPKYIEKDSSGNLKVGHFNVLTQTYDYNRKLAEYKQAIATAKDSAVLVSDRDKAARLIGQKYQDAYHKTHPMKWDIKPGIYPVPIKQDELWDDVASIISDENYREWDERVKELNEKFTITRK